MNPKSGTAGVPDSPVEPEKAKDALDANPGEVTSASRSPLQNQSKKWDQVQTSSSSGDEEQSRNSWISIELKDPQGRPVPNETYEIKLSDGTISSGVLDERGRARVEGIPSGQCQVRFPRLHNSEWRKA